jgi:hypothetical protein
MIRPLLFVLFVLIPTSLHAQTLYNETLGNFPGDQGWFLYLTNSPPNATQTYIPAQGTQLVTTNGAMAGYFNTNPITSTLVNPLFPTLDRAIGFNISLDLLVSSETHSSNDRAGFSIIALASDHRGIELGFWNNQIWAQNDSPLFTHGEGAAFDTTNRTSYQLDILGNSYDLFANGNSILTGSLRDYSSFGVPYSLNNFLFLGDDTSSADADITLGRVALSAVPEPATWISLGCAAFGGACWFRRRTRSARRSRTKSSCKDCLVASN